MAERCQGDAKKKADDYDFMLYGHLKVVGLIILLAFSVAGCSKQPVQPISRMSDYLAQTDWQLEQGNWQRPFGKTQPNRPERTIEVSFVTVGDIMVHAGQLKRAYQATDDSFDFWPSFSYVAPYIESADLAFGNLETTLAGQNINQLYMRDTIFMGYSGYPMFNSPDSLAQALKKAGFDFLLTANNHSLDTRLKGVVRTIEVLDKLSLNHTGTYLSQNNQKKVKIVEVKGMKVAIINYTYATNGISLAGEEMYRVNTLDMYKADKCEELYDEVRRAKQSEADLVWVFIHYGNEYAKYPDKYHQLPVTDKLLTAGADLVLGGHPHTLQPLIYLQDEQAFAGIYSLGNFISSQRNIQKYQADTDIGVILKWVYRRVGDLPPELVKIGVLPTAVIWQNNRVTVLPLTEQSVEAAEQDKELVIDSWAKERIAYGRQTIIHHLFKEFPEGTIDDLTLAGDGFYYYEQSPSCEK